MTEHYKEICFCAAFQEKSPASWRRGQQFIYSLTESAAIREIAHQSAVAASAEAHLRKLPAARIVSREQLSYIVRGEVKLQTPTLPRELSMATFFGEPPHRFIPISPHTARSPDSLMMM